MLRLVGTVMVVIGTSVGLCFSLEAPMGKPLDDTLLGSITGRDSFTGNVPADCAYSSMSGGQVEASNCPTTPAGPGRDPEIPGPHQQIECVTCFDGSYQAGTPPEFGGSGYKADGTFDCTNLWRRIGVCIDGTCQNFRTVQFCSGTPTVYVQQIR